MNPPPPSSSESLWNPGLGQFSKLPPEIRENIWLEFRPEQPPANKRPKCDLRVLRASQQLRDEVESAIYRQTTLQFSISSDYHPGKWDKPWATVYFKSGYRNKRVRATWIFKADAISDEKWFNGFPFHKIHSLEINLLAAGLSDDYQLLWLWRNVIRTVRLLKMAKNIPPMTIRLEKCEYGYHENDSVDFLCTAYYEKNLCHDLILVPFFNVPNPRSITIETHSEKLSNSINWSVTKWALNFLKMKPDGYLIDLADCMFGGRMWVHGRVNFGDRCELAARLRIELDSRKFYPEFEPLWLIRSQIRGIDPTFTSTIPVRLRASTIADVASSEGPTTPSGEETTEQVLSLEPSLATEAEMDGRELRRLQFLGRFGDYAGRVVKTVQEAVPKTLPSSVVDLRKGLERELSANPPGEGKLYEALGSAANILSACGFSIDVKMIELAVNAYSSRNEAFHSRLASAKVAWNAVQVFRIVQEDLDAVASLLPEAELGNLQSWRRMIDFYAKREDELVLEVNRSTVRDFHESMAEQLQCAKYQADWQRFRQAIEKDADLTSSRQRSPSNPIPMSYSMERKAALAFSDGIRRQRLVKIADHLEGNRRPRSTRSFERFLEDYQASARALYEKNSRQALKHMERHVAGFKGPEAESKGK